MYVEVSQCLTLLKDALPVELEKLRSEEEVHDGQQRISIRHTESSAEITIVVGGSASASSLVQFADSPLVPWVYRGRRVPCLRVPAQPVLMPGEVLAESNMGPIWCCRNEQGIRRDFCAVSKDWFKCGDAVFQHLSGERLMDLLPLIHWLKGGDADQPSQLLPLRACFQFDDPNLHSASYGFISFADTAQHARQHRYHVAMATIPMDTYFVNACAAALFRNNPECLSFLIHGNNHTHRELARPYADGAGDMLLQQGLDRIERLEQTSGVRVSRVMAAPHGACSETMLSAMARNGFEAASISSGSLRSYNNDRPWTRHLGLAPVEVIAGLPVMNRFRLKRGCETSVLLAAYLRQPIIPVGHHWDLADGLGLLEETATFVNSLGPVSWMSMGDIARSNYQVRLTGGSMQVRLYSRNARISIPAGVSKLRFDVPWVDLEKERVVCRSIYNGDDRAYDVLPVEISVEEAQAVEVRVVRRETATRPAKFRNTPISAVARRVLAEARDRAMVYMPKRFVKSG